MWRLAVEQQSKLKIKKSFCINTSRQMRTSTEGAEFDRFQLRYPQGYIKLTCSNYLTLFSIQRQEQEIVSNFPVALCDTGETISETCAVTLGKEHVFLIIPSFKNAAGIGSAQTHPAMNINIKLKTSPCNGVLPGSNHPYPPGVTYANCQAEKDKMWLSIDINKARCVEASIFTAPEASVKVLINESFITANSNHYPLTPDDYEEDTTQDPTRDLCLLAYYPPQIKNGDYETRIWLFDRDPESAGCESIKPVIKAKKRKKKTRSSPHNRDLVAAMHLDGNLHQVRNLENKLKESCCLSEEERHTFVTCTLAYQKDGHHYSASRNNKPLITTNTINGNLAESFTSYYQYLLKMHGIIGLTAISIEPSASAQDKLSGLFIQEIAECHVNLCNELISGRYDKPAEPKVIAFCQHSGALIIFFLSNVQHDSDWLALKRMFLTTLTLEQKLCTPTQPAGTLSGALELWLFLHYAYRFNDKELEYLLPVIPHLDTAVRAGHISTGGKVKAVCHLPNPEDHINIYRYLWALIESASQTLINNESSLRCADKFLALARFSQQLSEDETDKWQASLEHCHKARKILAQREEKQREDQRSEAKKAAKTAEAELYALLDAEQEHRLTSLREKRDGYHPRAGAPSHSAPAPEIKINDIPQATPETGVSTNSEQHTVTEHQDTKWEDAYYRAAATMHKKAYPAAINAFKELLSESPSNLFKARVHTALADCELAPVRTFIKDIRKCEKKSNIYMSLCDEARKSNNYVRIATDNLNTTTILLSERIHQLLQPMKAAIGYYNTAITHMTKFSEESPDEDDPEYDVTEYDEASIYLEIIIGDQALLVSLVDRITETLKRLEQVYEIRLERISHMQSLKVDIPQSKETQLKRKMKRDQKVIATMLPSSAPRSPTLADHSISRRERSKSNSTQSSADSSETTEQQERERLNTDQQITLCQEPCLELVHTKDALLDLSKRLKAITTYGERPPSPTSALEVSIIAPSLLSFIQEKITVLTAWRNGACSKPKAPKRQITEGKLDSIMARLNTIKKPPEPVPPQIDAFMKDRNWVCTECVIETHQYLRLFDAVMSSSLTKSSSALDSKLAVLSGRGLFLAAAALALKIFNYDEKHPLFQELNLGFSHNQPGFKPELWFSPHIIPFVIVPIIEHPVLVLSTKVHESKQSISATYYDTNGEVKQLALEEIGSGHTDNAILLLHQDCCYWKCIEPKISYPSPEKPEDS